MLAGLILIRVWSCNPPKPGDRVTLVLERSTDGRATWQAISTNSFVLPTNTVPVDLFADQMTDATAFYRAKIVPPPKVATEANQ